LLNLATTSQQSKSNMNRTTNKALNPANTNSAPTTKVSNNIPKKEDVMATYPEPEKTNVPNLTALTMQEKIQTTNTKSDDINEARPTDKRSINWMMPSMQEKILTNEKSTEQGEATIG
ncbi:25366_t:CDS:2, partial [Racocetra persica]